MRFLFGFALLATFALPSAPASAGEWCGFHDTANSSVKCGYSSLEECKQKEGEKGGICVPDPSFASDRHIGPVRRAG